MSDNNKVNSNSNNNNANTAASAAIEAQTALAQASQIIDNFYVRAMDENFKGVSELAKQNSFKIHMGVPSGKQVKDPITGKQVEVYDKFEEKTIERRKILQRDWKALDALRTQFQAERNEEKKSELNEKISRAGAFYFLGLSEEEWERVDASEIKPIIDACILRTTFPLPYSRQTSNGG